MQAINKENIKKVVLAYSGGLDTSIIIPWLKENYNNCEVIAVSGNVGQNDELEGLEEKAIKTGASKLYILDQTEEYVDEYIIPTMKAGAVYEDYLLGTSTARPCIAKGLVEIALKEGADAICHGCTGKGNDQVRFELAIKHFAPNMPIIAPWRIWDIKSREEEIEYAEAHNIPLKINRETNYSKDKNLWHLSHEGLDLEDTNNEPTYEKPGFLEMGVSPIDAPDEPTYLTLEFEKGVPVADVARISVRQPQKRMRVLTVAEQRRFCAFLLTKTRVTPAMSSLGLTTARVSLWTGSERHYIISVSKLNRVRRGSWAKRSLS